MLPNVKDPNIKLPSQMLLRLQSIYVTLKRAERGAADLLMEQPGFFAGSSIAAVAEAVGVSQPTFVRLAKRLGYSGFSEMKEVLLKGDSDTITLPQVPYEHINPGSKPYDIAQSIVYASIQALNGLLKVMNPQDYDNAVEALLKAERIIFLGAGDSGIVASSAFQKFSRLGAVCNTSSDYDTQMMLATLLNSRCVCVLISHSGDTASIVQAAKLAKAAGATTIAVTNFPYSHLARVCGIVLLTATFVERGGEVVTKRVAQLAIIESLFIICRLRGGISCDEAYSRTDQVFNDTNKL
jgi:RpiR family transcriptional regulator, carbohydrate utilization regulator